MFGQKSLYSGKVVVFAIGACIREKVVVLGQKWLYSGKVVVFRKKCLYSGKSDCNRVM